ncbi:DNA N-6-adenine-methyltransferase [Nocardia farcinica]
MPGTGISGHESPRAGSTVWLTPPHVLHALGEFDLDPCAAPEPRPWPTARHHITIPDDGLTAAWHGRVWLNPPYTSVAAWLDRLAHHGHGTALVFARTETEWFVRHVWQRAAAVAFLHGRITFRYPDGTPARANCGAPSCLVAYGPADRDRLAAVDLPATYIPLETR